MKQLILLLACLLPVATVQAQGHASCEVFPITRNIIDPAAKVAFLKDKEASNRWNATAAKDEYFPDKTGAIAILLVTDDKRSFIVGTQ